MEKVLEIPKPEVGRLPVARGMTDNRYKVQGRRTLVKCFFLREGGERGQPSYYADSEKEVRYNSSEGKRKADVNRGGNLDAGGEIGKL